MSTGTNTWNVRVQLFHSLQHLQDLPCLPFLSQLLSSVASVHSPSSLLLPGLPTSGSFHLALFLCSNFTFLFKIVTFPIISYPAVLCDSLPYFSFLMTLLSYWIKICPSTLGWKLHEARAFLPTLYSCWLILLYCKQTGKIKDNKIYKILSTNCIQSSLCDTCDFLLCVCIHACHVIACGILETSKNILTWEADMVLFL